ncbi:MAG: flagellar hook capping FlgD N-terminal domain-containing protein [Acidobacteriaceae bacterium]
MQLPLTSLLQTQNAAAAANSGLRSKAASGPTPTSSSSSSSAASTAAANSAVITANDFLSLLVTEIQNQDPTTQTDPMQYITQLVDVNNLEQLVQINANTTPSTSSNTSPTAQLASSTTNTVTGQGATTSTAPPLTAQAKAGPTALPLGSSGQMSSSAAQAVAQALGRSTPLASHVSATQLPPAHVAVQPEVLRAIEMSIPGATMTGVSTPGTLLPTPPAGAYGGGVH